ncbi:hypothetical protein ACWGHM_13670 [Streptomyces sp. NPDC054904]
MFGRVQDVVLEGPLRAQRLRDRPGLDGARVLAAGVGVQGAAGGVTEEADKGGHGGVGEVADGVQP